MIVLYVWNKMWEHSITVIRVYIYGAHKPNSVFYTTCYIETTDTNVSLVLSVLVRDNLHIGMGQRAI